MNKSISVTNCYIKARSIVLETGGKGQPQPKYFDRRKKPKNTENHAPPPTDASCLIVSLF